MRDFFFHTPTSLEEALGLLDQYGEDARVMSGGTALTVLMKQSAIQADHMVSLQQVPGLDYIRQGNGGLRIGGLTRHRDVETSPLVQERAPLLAQVYSRVATIRIRNVATVGGGLAHADPSQDPPTALLVLGASVTLASSKGERTVPVSELFRDYYETVLEPNEVLTEVQVPSQPPAAKTVYLRFLPRTADDYPTVAVAALGRVENGHCHDVRVALAAVAPTSVRATAVEEALQGQQVSQETVSKAAEAVAGQVSPLDDFRGSAEYKRDMAVVHTRRALEQVLGLTG